MGKGETVNKGQAGSVDLGDMLRDEVEKAVQEHCGSASGVVLHLVFERREGGSTVMRGPAFVWGDIDLAEHAKLFGRTLAIAERELMPGTDAATVQ